MSEDSLGDPAAPSRATRGSAAPRARKQRSRPKVTPAIAHTPGPWRACDEGACQCGQVWSLPTDQQIVTAHGSPENPATGQFIIAAAHSEWGDGPGMIYGAVPAREREANARLVAASPDLLEACRSVKAWLMDPFNAKDAEDPNLHPAFRKALRTVLAAIAKAEGRT